MRHSGLPSPEESASPWISTRRLLIQAAAASLRAGVIRSHGGDSVETYGRRAHGSFLVTRHEIGDHLRRGESSLVAALWAHPQARTSPRGHEQQRRRPRSSSASHPYLASPTFLNQ